MLEDQPSTSKGGLRPPATDKCIVRDSQPFINDLPKNSNDRWSDKGGLRPPAMPPDEGNAYSNNKGGLRPRPILRDLREPYRKTMGRRDLDIFMV